MADNDWKSRLGMVYSTDPGFKYETADRVVEILTKSGYRCKKAGS